MGAALSRPGCCHARRDEEAGVWFCVPHVWTLCVPRVVEGGRSPREPSRVKIWGGVL